MTPTSDAILDDLDPESLRSAVEANLHAWAVLRGRLPDVELHQDPDVTWLVCATPGGPNEVHLPRFDPDTVDDRMEGILGEYRAKSLAPQVWVGPGATPADLRQRLKRRGLVCLRHLPGMACDLGNVLEGVPGPHGVSLEPVRDFSVFQEFGHPVIGRISTPARRRSLDEGIKVKALAPEHVWHFAATLGDRPVGALSLFFGAGVPGIYDVGVLPEFRGRRIGSAMAVEACRFARDRGYRAAVLTSMPAGQAVYRRIGFEEICKMSLYYYSKTRQRRDRALCD
jgi:GNAT superfamily N-acetyltransferase